MRYMCFVNMATSFTWWTTPDYVAEALRIAAGV